MLFFVVACGNNDVTRYVDPNIGGVAPLLTTKVPTVHRPHSMARVFPVTRPGLNDRYLSDRIYGFAVNMPAYRSGNLTELMPFPGPASESMATYSSLYDHDLEEVHPWRHQVLLEDHNIIADWTTTERAVIYRFTFQDEGEANIVFRSKGNASFTVAGDRSLSGWEESRGVRQYFYAAYSVPFIEHGAIENGKLLKGVDEISGTKICSYQSFGDQTTPVEVRIGISFIDEDGPRITFTGKLKEEGLRTSPGKLPDLEE